MHAAIPRPFLRGASSFVLRYAELSVWLLFFLQLLLVPLHTLLFCCRVYSAIAFLLERTYPQK